MEENTEEFVENQMETQSTSESQATDGEQKSTTEGTSWYSAIEGLDKNFIETNKASFDKFKDVSSVVKSGIEASKKINELTQSLSETKSKIPTAPEAYDLGEIKFENSDMWTDKFKELNISNDMAKGLVEAFNGMQSKYEEEAFSSEGLNKIIPEAKRNELTPILKENLSSEDLEAVDKLPNEILGLIYRMAEKVKSNYGANEGGALSNAAQGSINDLEKAYDAKYDEIIKYSEQMNQDPVKKKQMLTELNNIIAKQMELKK